MFPFFEPDDCKASPVSAQIVTPLHVSYPKQDSDSLIKKQEIVPSISTQPSLLKIGAICEYSPCFVFAGKVLNRYGTYKLPTLAKLGEDSKVPRYLKCDLADQDACNTITLSIVDNSISLYQSKLIVGSFV